MAALGSQSIASSYEQILQVDRDGGGDTTTHVSVKDGDNGTTFGFTIASDALMMSSTNRLEFGDTGTYIHQSADGVLDLVSDTEIELNGTIDINGAVTMDGGNVTINDDSADYDFRVESNGNANMLFVDGGNNLVGIGTASPGNILDVTGIPTGSLTPLVSINNDGTAGHQLALELDLTENAADNNSSKYLNCTNGTVRCVIYSDGDIQNHDNSYGSISDERIKQDIRDANSQWDDIKALKVRNFKRKDDMAQYGDDAWEQIGVVAQEVEEAGMDKLVEHSPPSDFELEHCGFGTKTADAIPATYYEESDDIPEGKSVGDVKTEEVKEVWSVNQDDDGNDMQVKSMKYSILYMKAVKALQEAIGRIESLESKVEALEG